MLELGGCSVSFEADCGPDIGGNSTLNFFDAVTHNICTMRNNGGLGLTCKSLYSSDVISTRTKDKGPVMLVKLSPSGKAALLQRHNTSVDVILIEKTANSSSLAPEFNVPTKSKEPLLTVEWINNTLLLLITRQSMELVNVNLDKKSAKFQKTTNIAGVWSKYYPAWNMVLVATGPQSLTIQPILIQNGQFHRLKCFDVDLGSEGCKENLLEKDVTLLTMYGRVYLAVLRYNVHNSTTTDIAMYELTNETTANVKLQYTLSLGFSGGFGIHAIDNMVIVHHQPSRQSMIFDVALCSQRPSHSPLITTSIRAVSTTLPEPALYTPYWSIFQPDIIADPPAGIMYRLSINYEHVGNEIEDKATVIEFLLHRSGQNSLVIRSLFSAIRGKEVSLRQIRKLFDILAQKHAVSESGTTSTNAVPNPDSLPVGSNHRQSIVEQQELLSGVFIPLKEDDSVDKSYIANVMLQYLQSLNKAGITVQAYFLELLVEALVVAGEMAILQQLVTYRVIGESKPLAFLLLSYEARCPQLFQSGVDILCRQKGVDEIIEVLLDKGFVVDAVRFLAAQPHSSLHSAKLVEASSLNSRLVQYAVCTHFGTKREKLEEFISSIYGADEVSKAERETAIACFSQG